MSQLDILGDDSLWLLEEEEDTVESGGTGLATDGNTNARWERCIRVAPIEDIHRMEIFGLDSALDRVVLHGGRKASANQWSLQGGEGLKRSSSAGLARVSQALVQRWRQRSLREKLVKCAPRGAAPANQVKSAPAAVVRPTPSEILICSSIRMMISMASAFRLSNPAVLEATCGTLLELLLEVPSLALAPLRSEPSSIEATTFSKVSEFCTELMGSPSPVERGSGLGLYLTLAISRGDVSGLLEVVIRLLNCQSSLLARTDYSTGATEYGFDRFSIEQEARISSVLNKIADHKIDLHLSFPDECEGTRLAIRLPARSTRARYGGPGNAPVTELDRAEGDEDIDFDCPATAATDGKFVYAWHPDIGLLKAGTGLFGTAKGRIYVENEEAGRASLGTCGEIKGGNGEGFMALIGERIYLRAGACTNPTRFLVARTSDLAIEGSIEALAFASITDPLERNSRPTAFSVRTRAFGDTLTEPSEREGKQEARLDEEEEVWRRESRGKSVEVYASDMPMFCDGRLVYALVPLESTSRPSVIAVDLVNDPACLAIAPVELHRPRPLRKQNDVDGESVAHPSDCGPPSFGNINRNTFQLSGEERDPTGHGRVADDSTAMEEWPWWRDGGAMPGVRVYCNGDRLVVCWLDDAEKAAETKSKPCWWGRLAETGISRGIVPSPQDNAGAGKTDFGRITHMARFRLSTGKCEDVENNASLSGTWRPHPPCVSYDPASNLILRCSLRSRPASMPPSPYSRGSGSGVGSASAAELYVSLWRNCGLAPSAVADGRYEWKEALATLAQLRPSAEGNLVAAEEESAKVAKAQSGQAAEGLRSGIPAMSSAALYVLAHLDRLGGHFLSWGDDMVRADEAGSLKARKGSSVPFCYDLAPETFKNLVRLVKECSATSVNHGRDGVPGHMRVYVLCASLRLMRVNVGILLGRGLGAKDFGDSDLRRSFLECLLGLVREYDGSESTPVDAVRAVASREALKALVGSIDLLYPTERTQALLLFSYLHAYEANGGYSSSPAERTLTLELLARASTITFLQNLKLIDSDRGPSSSGDWPEAQLSVGPGLEAQDVTSPAPDVGASLIKVLLDVSTRQSVRDVRRAAATVNVEFETTASQDAHFRDWWRVKAGKDSAGPIGEAVLAALGVILNLKAADVFLTAASEPCSSGKNEGIPTEFGTLIELFLSVLSAAQTVLGSIETVGLLPRVLDTLRSGLVGTLLPLCLTSALALVEKIVPDVFNPSGADEMVPLLSPLQERLVQVFQEVGRLLKMARGDMTRVLARDSDAFHGTNSGLEGVNQKYLSKASGPHSVHDMRWVIRLEALCVSLGASMIRRLVTGGPQSREEEANARWLRHPLLCHTEVDFARYPGAAALTEEASITTPRSPKDLLENTSAEFDQRKRVDRVYRFSVASSTEQSRVEQLCAHLRGKETHALAAAMRRVVPEDRGYGQVTNEPVWAAAVAIVHHAGLAEEAAEVVQAEFGRTLANGSISGTKGETDNAISISPALREAWRSAQQARSWVENKAQSPDEKKALISRAAFLLCLTPWTSTDIENSSDCRESTDPLFNACSAKVPARITSASELVLEFLLPPSDSHVSEATQGDGEVKSVGFCAVNEVSGASQGNPSALLRIMELRSARAKARAKGFSAAERLLDGGGSKRSIEKTLRAVAEGLSEGCRESVDLAVIDGNTSVEGFSQSENTSAGPSGSKPSQLARLYFLCGVEGCDIPSKLALQESVKAFLRQCSRVLQRDFKVWGLSSAEGRRSVVMQALRAVSMDYGREDHELLETSQILSPLSSLVYDIDPHVAAAAFEEMLGLYRAAKAEAGTVKPGRLRTSTPFQAAFCRAIRLTLQKISLAFSEKQSPVTMLDDLTIPLDADEAGLVVPHFPVGTRLSLSLWVLFPSVEGSDVEHSTDSASSRFSKSYLTGTRCVVRRTPCLNSEIVGILDAAVVVEVMPPDPENAIHPEVYEGRRVRLRSPLEGYVSVYSATGSSTLYPILTTARRSSSDRDLHAGVDRAPPVPLRAQESPFNLTRPLSRLTTHTEEEVEVRSRSPESGPRRVNRSTMMQGVQESRDFGALKRAPPAVATGGILLFKGNETLLGRDEAACSWNRFGIEVTSAGALRYFVGEGNVLEASVASADGCVFDVKGINRQGQMDSRSPRESDKDLMPGWRHIAVVQDEEYVSLFLDGQCCGRGSLPRHLLRPSRPQYRTIMREVESPHPYPNSMDETWSVHILGASSVTVRFDPESRTEPDSDFVRFYRDRTRTKTWGLDKYHGGRSGSPSNWPGVDLPPLKIPAESFVVYFHSDGTHNDYGFRLTAEGEHPVFDEAEPREPGVGDGGLLSDVCDDVNPWPVYLGQPPLHASRRKTVDGGLVARIRAWRRPLLIEEVEVLALDLPQDFPRAGDASVAVGESSVPGYVAVDGDGREQDRAGLAEREGMVQMTGKVLALVHACCRSDFGRQELSVPATMGALLRQILFGGSEIRLLALRVCRTVLPWVEPGLVDGELRSIARERELDFDETFVGACLRLIGETADVLGRSLRGISLAEEKPSAAAARDEAAPLEATVSIMDMLLARSACPAIRVRVSSKTAFSLSRELISLLHDLMASPEKLASDIDKSGRGSKDQRSAWSGRILNVVRTWLRRSGPLVEILQRRKRRSEQALWAEAREARGDFDDRDGGEDDGALGKGGKDLSVVDDLSRIVGVLSFLGGHVEGLHPGAKVFCGMPSRDIGSSRCEGQNLGLGEIEQDWGNGFAEEEATVLRLGLSRGSVPGTLLEKLGRTSPRAPDRNTARDPVQQARPVFATREPSSVVPMDVYDYLADNGRAALSTSAMAREIVRGNQHRQRVQEQQRQEQQQQQSEPQQERQLEDNEDVPACTLSSAQGNVVRGEGQEWVMLQSSDSSHAGGSPSSAGPEMAVQSGGGRVAACPQSLLQPIQDRCNEWVTIGRVRGGRENAPEVATVPIDRVKLARTKVPRELTMALKPYAEEFVPHLKTLLEADTAFRGPRYRPLEKVCERQVVVESAHPYQSGEDRTWPIDIESAETIEVSFDPMSQFADASDQLIFSWRGKSGGSDSLQRLSLFPASDSKQDDDGSQRWPGVHGEPPLVVAADSLSFRFLSVAVETDASPSGAEEKEAGSLHASWGFRLTARSREIRQEAPPEQPPSLDRVVLNDLRVRTVKSAETLMAYDEAPSGLRALVPALTKIALEALPQVAAATSWRTHTLESAHPYENGTTETFHVSSKGAARLLVAFHPQSRTETNCDFVAFYNDPNHVKRWGEERYSGRDGVENWPGFGRRPPLEIPASHVYVEWLSDSAVTDWGWKMTITAEQGDVDAVITPPATFEQRLGRAYELLHEQPRPPKRLPEAEFVRFPMGIDSTGSLEDTPAVRDHDIASSQAFNIASPLSTPDHMSSSDTGDGGIAEDRAVPPLDKGREHVAGVPTHGGWPRRYVVCVGGVEAFDAPKVAEQSVVKLRPGAIVTVVAQRRDWLKIIHDPQAIFEPPLSAFHSEPTSPSIPNPVETDADVVGDGGVGSATSEHVWVRQRQDETLFLVPEKNAVVEDAAAVVYEVFLEEDEGEDRGDWTASVGDEEELDADDELGLAAAGRHNAGVDLGEGSVAYNAWRDLEGYAGVRLWGFVTDTLRAAASRFGVSVLLKIAKEWRGGDGELFSPDLFGSVERLWEFLKLTSVIFRGDLQSAAMRTLKRRLVECVRGKEGAEFGRCLVGHALGVLQGLAARPGQRAVARVIETPHPYDNNMNLEWLVKFPGAQRIKVVFDPRSRTETNCDWLSIQQESDTASDCSQPHSETDHKHHFHGRHGRENFPGFGGRPPLWLEGDRFVARFRSDSYTTDWGVRFTAYGIFDDGGASASDVLHGVQSWYSFALSARPECSRMGSDRSHGTTNGGTERAVNLEVELCCWLLEFLSCEGWKGVPDVAARFCESDAVESFRACVRGFLRRPQLRILRLVSCVISEACRAAACRGTPSVVAKGPLKPSSGDVDALLCDLLGMLDAQHAIEADPGAASPYLQTLIRCAVLLHGCLASEAKAETRMDGEEKEEITPGEDEGVVSMERVKLLERRLLGMGPGSAAVHAFREIVPDFAEGKTPEGLLFESFLPILTEACTVTIQSRHPFGRRPLVHSVVVPGAVELRARFDHRTGMGESDKIVLRHPKSSVGEGKLPPTASGDGSILLREGSEIDFVGLAGGTDSAALPVISVGDRVVRGPDWAFGDEDCDEHAVSGVGVVIGLEKWEGKRNNGVRVRWLTGVNGGFEALYSAVNPAHLRVVERGGSDRARRPVTVSGDAFEVEVSPGVSGKVLVGGSCDGIPGQSVDARAARCLRFDGKSTFVDLPNYRGMRLEGDFAFELWAWLEPGAAKDGSRKCVLSRVFNPSLRRGRRSSVLGATSGQDATFSKGARSFTGSCSEGNAEDSLRFTHDETIRAPDNKSGSMSAATDVVRATSRVEPEPNVDVRDERVFGGMVPTSDYALGSASRSAVLDAIELRMREEKGDTGAQGPVTSKIPREICGASLSRCDMEGEGCTLEVDDGDYSREEADEEELAEGDAVESGQSGDGPSMLVQEDREFVVNSDEDAVPGVPERLVSTATDRSITISWSPPARPGRPALHSYIVYRDDSEIASVGDRTLSFADTNLKEGWTYSYSVAARGPSGMSPPCAGMGAKTATGDDKRTQLALWVVEEGDVEFMMENERGVGIVLAAGPFPDGVWTHLAVSMEGPKVSIFVDGERRAQGNFFGLRPTPTAEPLRLGSREAGDFWKGRLCRARLWGASAAAAAAAGVPPWMNTLPPDSLVRSLPSLSHTVTVAPNATGASRRFRVHAPMLEATASTVDGRGKKAYYEVIIRSSGWAEIGWVLPGINSTDGIEEDYVWGIDGVRAIKWHGSTSNAAFSREILGAPYGQGWEWHEGDVIGCAVDLDAGEISFSHNGRDMGKAFVMARGFGAGRYRVISPDVVECREHVDPKSPVVDTLAPWTVVQVLQAERLSENGTLRLRTPFGWVSEREPFNPDRFYLERLAQDIDDNVGVGPERCVFASPLLLADEGNQETEEYKHAELSPTLVNLPEYSGTPSQGLDLNPVGDGHQGESTRLSLFGSVDVGEASSVTFAVELFVLSERSAPERGVWKWGVTMGNFEIYLTTDREDEVEDERSERSSRRKAGMHIVLRGPGGLLRTLSMRSEFRGRWITLRVSAHRSGKSSLTCTLSSDDSYQGVRKSSPGDSAPPHSQQQLDPSKPRASESPPLEACPQARCTFYNPTWFRGSHVDAISLRGERPESSRPGSDNFPLRARSAAVFLGSVVDLPLPSLERMIELKRLLEKEHPARQSEIPAFPLFSCPRQRQRLVWSGEVVRRLNTASPTAMTVWQCVPSPGRVSFGSTVRLSQRGPGSASGGDDNSGQSGEAQTRSFTALEHPALQTPERFDPVPLPAPLLGEEEGGLWAWAPVPRSNDFLSMGLVFTAAPEPPSVNDVRCLRSALVEDVEPHDYKVVNLRGRREADRPGKGEKQIDDSDSSSNNLSNDGFCDEIMVVVETGLCFPKEGLTWGLSPRRVAVGCAGTGVPLGWRRNLRWDGLMPVLSGTAGQSVEINLGRSAFLYPKQDCLPVSEMAQTDARFVVQVYCDADKMWRDVSHGGFLGVSVAETRDLPELIGSWTLGSVGKESDNNRGVLENDVFTVVTAASVQNGSVSSSGSGGGVIRLPPAVGGGVLEAIPAGGLTATVVGGVPEVWGFSLRVSPLFPTDLDGVHPWLRRRFEEFKDLVWEKPAQAQVVNKQLMRGFTKGKLLSCEWASLQPSHAELSEWPPSRSIESAAALSSESRTASPPSSGVVEETKQSALVAEYRNEGWDDEWVLVTLKAPTAGVAVLDEPCETAKVVWRILPGQVLRLLPRLEARRRGGEDARPAEDAAEESEWRRVDGVEGGWLVIPPEDDYGSARSLERFWTTRLIQDGFPSRVSNSELRVGGSASESARNFWLQLLPSGPAVQTVVGGAAVGASPCFAMPLQGDSDALLTTSRDVGVTGSGDGGNCGVEDRPLLVVGMWRVGVVTDTLTVTTRTSGCTRIIDSDGADEDVLPALAALGEVKYREDNGQSTKQQMLTSSSQSVPTPMSKAVLCDGLVFGFRAVDGLLVITRAISRGDGADVTDGPGSASPEPVERRALSSLGSLEEGVEVCFVVVDAGEDVLFNCREVGGQRRTATVRARCEDSWGRGRVALGARAAAQSSTKGWLRVVSQAHGATVRAGMSIDTDSIVGRIPCGAVVPYDNAIVFHSPSAPNLGAIDPVVRYRCLATATTPAGWISERGRFAQHPYRICEQIRVASPPQPHLLSYVSVGRVWPPTRGWLRQDQVGKRNSWLGSFLPLPRRAVAREPGRATPSGSKILEREWRRQLDKLSVISVRFGLLQRLNLVVLEALPFIDLSEGDLWWSMTALLSRCRHLIFSTAKQEIWQAEMERTAHRPTPQPIADGAPPLLEVRLSRRRAALQAKQLSSVRRGESEERHTLFGQAFLALRDAPIEAFRLNPGEVLYNTVFLGEHAHDAGGPYRESFAEYCAELQSGALPLLIRCPNAVNDVGINREKWVPNPSIGHGPRFSPALHAEMLRFLGQLMGVAIRSQQPLDLNLPSIVWKQLVRSPITKQDLEAIDCQLTQSLSSIRTIHLRGVKTEEAFKDLGLGGFDVPTADGRRVPIETRHGKNQEITLENRLEFADKAEKFKMREFWEPVEAIRQGLDSVIPMQLLRLFCWDEIEVLACGRKEVDVELLEACTEYIMCSRQDAHVSAFWEVLRSFSLKDKSLFLRFAWGRSRLPLSAEQFHQSFKIQAFSKGPADVFLPVAHTCFFSLDLPRYSSREVLEAKLRYAIHNCLAIDADDTSVGRNAAGMSWGEGP